MYCVFNFEFYLLLVYRKAIKFCTLTLYPKPCSNGLLFPGVFGRLFWTIYIEIRSSVIKINFIFFLFKLYIFVSFSWLIALVSIPSTMLKRSGARGHFCSGPGLIGKASSFPLLSMILTGFCFVVNILFQVDEVPPPILVG